MNYGMLLRVIGNLLVFEAFALIVPLGISFYYNGNDLYPIIYTIMIMLAIGYPFSKYKVKNIKSEEK